MPSGFIRNLNRNLLVKDLAASIPKSLWYIFLPMSRDGFTQLEEALRQMPQRDFTRHKVMELQRMWGLPLRPNDTLSDTAAKLRQRGKEKAKLLEEYKKRRAESSDSESDFRSDVN